MFILPKNDNACKTIENNIGHIDDALMRLRDSVQGLTFEPEEHKYMFAGKQIPSVSSVIERYAPFDRMAVASGCSRNPHSEYYGMNVDNILSTWEAVANAGTAVHAFGEACYLFTIGRESDIEEQFRNRITAEGLAAESPKEEAVARWWAEQDWSRYAPVAKETRIYNPELLYAGTFDLLLFDAQTRKFAIRDYKTNKDLFKWVSGRWLGGQFNKVLKDNDEGKYTLQQNMYSIQLRNIGLDVDDIRLVWLKEDRSWQEVNIPNREKLITFELRTSQHPAPPVLFN